MQSANIVKIAVTGLTGCFMCVAANAETSGQFGTPERINVLVTYGDDECPEAKGDEIVVCAARPESERYRIPKELREAEKEAEEGEQSWTSVLASHDEAARSGRPNSCSVVGTFGFSGCQSAIMRQWFDERRFDGN